MVVGVGRVYFLIERGAREMMSGFLVEVEVSEDWMESTTGAGGVAECMDWIKYLL